MAEDLLYARIKERSALLTPTQARIAQHITQNVQRLAHSTVRELSEAIGVSNSAIVRFAQALGFEGFPELQSAARDMLAERLTMVERFASSQAVAREDQVEEILRQDLRNLQLTSRDLSREDLARAARAVASARRVYIVGYRNAGAMGILLAATLGQVLDNVHQITADVGDAADKLASFQREDVVIAIAFPRYARVTIRAAEFAAARGCTLVALTDGPASPITRSASFSFFAHIESTALPYSYAGVVGLINAIIVAVARHVEKPAQHRLRDWEEAVGHLDLLVGLSGEPTRTEGTASG